MDATELRRKAALFRRMANVPTTGGHRADHHLLTLAEKLERQAAELDRGNMASSAQEVGRCH